MRFVITYLAVIITSIVCYSQHLPIIQDGKWGVIDTNGRVIITPSYQKVDPFHNGYAVAAQHEKYGLIDLNNKIQIPFKYHFLEFSIENKYLVYQNHKYGLINDQDDVLLELKYDYIYPISDSQLIVLKNEQMGLFDASIRIPIAYDSINFMSSLKFYAAHGKNQIDVFDTNYIFQFQCKEFLEENGKIELKEIVYPNGDTLSAIKHLYGSNFIFKQNNRFGLFNFYSKQPLFQAAFSSIDFDQNWLYLHKEDSVYIADLMGNIIVKIKGDDVYMEERGVWVRSEGYVGYLLNNGTLIPPRFDNIYENDDFFMTYLNGKYGLYAKNGRKILNAVYDELIFNERNLKAYRGNQLRTMEFSKGGSILKDKTYNNAMRVNLRATVNATWQPSPLSSDANGRLNYDYKYGWYQQEKLDSNNQIVYGRLGVSINDSTKMRPQYYRIVYWDSIGMTQAKLKTMERKEKGFRVRYLPHDFVPFNSHKKANKGRLMYSEPVKWDNYAYQDVIINSQLYYMNASMELSEKMGYIDNYYEDMSIFQTLGKGPEEKCDYFNCLYRGRLYTSKSLTEPKNISFKNGQWGFMSAKGEIKFQGKFDRIERFHNGTSIVEKGGKGLVNKDSIVIPPKYKSLTRIPELGDTVFYASSNKFQQYFTDSVLHPYAFKYHSIIKRINDKLWIKKSNNENGMLSSDLTFTPIKGIIKANFDEILLVKKRGLYGLFDLDGEELLGFKYISIDRLQEGYRVKEKRNFGYVDANGNLVLPTDFQEIAQASHGYITAKKDGFFGLYDSTGQLVLPHDYKMIHINPQDGSWIVTKKNGKVYYYDEANEKLKALEQKDDNYQIVGSFDQFLIYSFKKHFGLLDSSNYQVVTPPHFESFDTISYDMIQLNKGRKFKVLFRSNRKVSDKFYQAHFKSFDSLMVFQRGNTYQFYNQQGVLKHEQQFQQAEASSHGLMLVRNHLGCYFLNVHFQNEFNDYYKSANSFYGNAACINKGEGWQIINRSGFKKTQPSYGFLRPLFDNVFEVKSYEMKGVFNSQGKEIVPVSYLRINLLDHKIFQAVTDGEIHYYDLEGKRLY